MLLAHASTAGVPSGDILELLGAIALAVLVGLYVRAVQVLRERGRQVPTMQKTSFAVAAALLGIGLVGPPARLSEDLLLAHMAQHLLIADLAAPLLLIGLRTPVLVFLWPRSVVTRVARYSHLRSTAAQAVRPEIALPLWLGVLLIWHVPPMFVAAIRHPEVHAVQHLSFWVTAVLAWWALIEPAARRSRGAIWKAAHVFVARMVGGLLGVALIEFPTALYGSAYGNRAVEYGLDTLTDQQIAGTMMMTVDFALIVIGVVFFMLRSASDHDAAYAAPAISRQQRRHSERQAQRQQERKRCTTAY